MKKSLNLNLLEFHVREAAQELDLLLDAIQYAKDGTLREGAVGDEPLRWPLREGALAASLEHAYHHLNFAWNGRFKTMREADAQFDRNEKFPRPRGAGGWFAKFWPRVMLRCGKRSLVRRVNFPYQFIRPRNGLVNSCQD